MGAGLGGGSADAASMLKMLNETFDLDISDKQLHKYALQLGSDCPFFLINKPCFATGRGEILKEIELDLTTYQFVIINPQIHVSTREAFSQLTPAAPHKSITDIIHQPIETWQYELKNDFEKTVFATYPAIADIKEQLYQSGAIYASMSGSGSSVHGIFKRGFIMPRFADNYKIFLAPN